MISPLCARDPVSAITKQCRISVAVMPLLVDPPLDPVKAGAHGGEYTDSTCRGGLPKPYGQALATFFFGGVVVPVGDSVPDIVVVVVASSMPPGVPLLAWLKDENTDCCLSGGASGENALLEVGWS